MDDEMRDPIEPGEEELARRLQAYADARMTPSDEATARMRATVETALGSLGRAAHEPAAATRRFGWRRSAATLLAGGLTLAIVAGAAAYSTRPGAPFYAARLWTEAVNLPTAIVVRAQAEVDRLERRIQEARDASDSGDAGAADAALIAYSTILTEAASEVDGFPDAMATLEATLTREVVVLAFLVETVPEPAMIAATQALQTCNMTLDELNDR